MNCQRIGSQNVVILFDYSWFLAKNLAFYDSARVIDYYFDLTQFYFSECGICGTTVLTSTKKSQILFSPGYRKQIHQVLFTWLQLWVLRLRANWELLFAQKLVLDKLLIWLSLTFKQNFQKEPRSDLMSKIIRIFLIYFSSNNFSFNEFLSKNLLSDDPCLQNSTFEEYGKFP